jgi:uncharacterized membrane protein
MVDATTGVAIGVGVVSALVRMANLSVRRRTNLDCAMSEIRITLGRWLALALELALAADILRTVMIPNWDEIGKLGAIVVLRTSPGANECNRLSTTVNNLLRSRRTMRTARDAILLRLLRLTGALATALAQHR